MNTPLFQTPIPAAERAPEAVMSDDDRAAVRLATAEAEAEGERLKLEREEPQRQAPAAAAAPPAARPPAAAAAQNGTHAASPPAAPRPDPSAAPATWRAVRTDALSPSPAAAQVLGRWGLSTCGLLADWLADRGGALGGTGSSSAAEVLKSAGVRHRDAQQVVRELKAVRRQYEGKAKANTKQAPAPENQAAPQAGPDPMGLTLGSLSDLPTRLVGRLEACGFTTVGQVARLLGGGEEEAVRALDAAGVRPPDAAQAVRAVRKLLAAQEGL